MTNAEQDRPAAEYLKADRPAAELTRQEALGLAQNCQSEGGLVRPLLVEGGASSAFEIAQEAFGEGAARYVRLALDGETVRIDGSISEHRTPRQLYDRLGALAADLAKGGLDVVLSVEDVDRGGFGALNAIRAHALDEPSPFRSMVFAAKGRGEIPAFLSAMCARAVIGPLGPKPEGAPRLAI